MLQRLDKILLGENVCKDFLTEFEDSEFNEWMMSLLSEIEDCLNTEQDNPWHIYNCLEHILHSVEEINKQTKNLPHNERRLLAYTMFLHDIGKPQTKFRRYARAYKREVDSFFDHNVVGAEIAGRVLKNFNFSTREQEEIKALVKEHDMFISLKLEDDNKYGCKLTTDVLKDKIFDLNRFGDGEKLMQYLLYVARADNKAQNPEMTKESLKKIDVAQTYLDEICLEKKI